MIILDSTRERFLLAIAAQIPLDHVAEIHFFAPVRQGGVESGVAVVATVPDETATGERHTIYTARYRHTLKGPDRGKWDASVTAEADAPLITVEAVVRGVQRRAGDMEEPTRMTGDEVRSITLPPPTGTAGATRAASPATATTLPR